MRTDVPAMFFKLFGTYSAGCDINRLINLLQLRVKKKTLKVKEGQI